MFSRSSVFTFDPAVEVFAKGSDLIPGLPFFLALSQIALHVIEIIRQPLMPLFGVIPGAGFT